MKAGFGDWYTIAAMPDDLRRMLWYGNHLREGAEINWRTGDVKYQKR